MIREAIEDTILSVPNEGGEPGMRQIPVPKGLQVVVDMVGVRTFASPPSPSSPTYSLRLGNAEYNPKYFPDPQKYDPKRWQGVSTESESVTAFSIGTPLFPSTTTTLTQAPY